MELKYGYKLTTELDNEQTAIVQLISGDLKCQQIIEALNWLYSSHVQQIYV